MREYMNCVRYGPGEESCRGEIDSGTDPLGSLCEPFCVIPSMPPSPPPGMCTGECEDEFEHCVQSGGHADPCAVCNQEIADGTPPLSHFCAKGCSTTTKMSNLCTG